MPRRKKKDSGDELRGDEWLGTYSDCVTLLLTFFILLYTTASTDTSKLKALSRAMQNVFTGSDANSILEDNLYSGKVPIVGEDGDSTEAEAVNAKDQMYEKVTKFVKENSLANDVDVKKDARGVSLLLKDTILFESGKADLLPDSIPILNQISSLISTMPNKIIIEGHTDNLPINTYKFENNWYLSSFRATNVLRYFVETKGLTPNRFSSEGCGEFRPIAPNNSPENRAKNRRVNILILTSNEE